MNKERRKNLRFMSPRSEMFEPLIAFNILTTPLYFLLILVIFNPLNVPLIFVYICVLHKNIF